VRPFAYRKWIVFFALMCQVLSATLVHVPVASASPLPHKGVATHCPDQVDTVQSGDRAEHAQANSNHGPGDSGDHGCKNGHCKCPCAHSPAVSADIDLPASNMPHLPVTVVYAPPSLPVQLTPFFRPPI
jgi:hypothetical protein